MKERFPALERLEAARGRGLRFIAQMSTADCGPACLAMAARYWGCDVSADAIRERTSSHRDGTSLACLKETAEALGFRARAVRAELSDLDDIPRGTILHWRMSHYVVFDRRARDGARILDPAAGPRAVSMRELDESFTGAALLLEPRTPFEPARSGRSRVWEYLGRVLRQSRILTRIVLMSAVAQGVGLAMPLLVGAIVDRVVPRGDVTLLQVIAIGITGIAVFSSLTSYVRAQLLLQLRTHLDLQLTLEFADHLLRLPFSFFQVRQTGDLMMRMNSNSAIRETLTSGALSAVLDGFMVTMYLVILLWTSPTLGVLVIGLGGLRVTLFALSRRRYRQLTAESLRAQAEASNYQVQILQGIETLKVAGAERHALERFSHLLVNVTNVNLRSARLSSIVDSLLGALGTASYAAILCLGAWLVIQGRLTLGTMLAMGTLANGFLGPLSSLVSMALQFQTLESMVERVDDVLEKETEQPAGTTAPAPRLGGRAEVREVSFRYSEHSPTVLDRVTIEIAPGSRIAIVGPSGSGKSTLARLLCGLYHPTEGSVRFDDFELFQVDLPSLRRQIGFVPQSAYLFAGTIRQNIALGEPEARLGDIQNAARLASIHDDIMAMPLGYDTSVAASGGSLSGGQRQRVALARAVLNRPRILVLDEATSHLDPITEARVLANLSALEATTVVIAHRLTTIQDSDRIYVLEGGRVVEQGVHAELIDRHGLYADLYRSQASEARV